MSETTFTSANSFFGRKKYADAYARYCSCVEKNDQPAFCSFMAGTCRRKQNDDTGAYSWYQKALSFDDSNAFINREIERFMAARGLNNPAHPILRHCFPTTTNIGDAASAAGIRTMLRRVREDIFFFSLSARHDTIDKLASYTPRPAGMIIGGGGLFFRQPLPSGWYFPLSREEAAGLNLPIITYAVGLNREHSGDRPWNLDARFITELAAFHEVFSLKSVRDIWSRDTLVAAGVNDLHLVSCPSAFLQPLPWLRLPVDSSKSIVGISVTDRALPQKDCPALRGIFIRFAQWLSAQGYSPLFILHDTADDLALAEHITKNGIACFVPVTPREAVTAYSRCAYVVGMRGHSLILAAGQGVPVLAVSYNKKVDAFMEMLDLQHLCFSQNQILEKHSVVPLFEALQADRDATQKKVVEKRELFYQSNLDYCRKIVSILSL